MTLGASMGLLVCVFQSMFFQLPIRFASKIAISAFERALAGETTLSEVFRIATEVEDVRKNKVQDKSGIKDISPCHGGHFSSKFKKFTLKT